MGIDVLSPVEQARGSGPAPLPPPVAAEQPVFTDPDGRRARVVTLAGRALACLLLLWLIAVAAGIAGLGTLPGVPDLGGSTATGAERPGSKVAGAPSTGGEGVMPGAGNPAADRGRDGEAAAFGTAGGRGGSVAGKGSAPDRSFLRGGSGDAPPRGRGRGEPPSPPWSRVLARRESTQSRDRPAVPPPAAQQAPSAQGAPAPPEGRPQNAPAAERAPGRPEAPPSSPAKAPSAGWQGPPAGAPAPGPPPGPPGQSRTASAPQPAPAPGAPARGGGGPPPHAQASPSSP